MLRLRDRVAVALGAGMGIALSPDENVRLAELLVRVDQLMESRKHAVCSNEQKAVIDSAARLFVND